MHHAQQLTALGHPGRLAVFRLLARRAPAGMRPGEMADALGLKSNTLSVYLSALSDAGLIQADRQGRAIHYRIDWDQAATLVDYLVADCCRGRPDLCRTKTIKRGVPMSRTKPMHVLFICSGNSARSIFAEALLRDLGGDRFVAHSAGTRPSGAIHPRTLDLLARNGHSTDGLRSKSTEEFQTEDAPMMDFVFTVCDTAANEECPPWPGQPITAHWGLPDPVKAEGTEAEQAYAFAQVYAAFLRRIQAFTHLPFDTLDRVSLQANVDRLGVEEGN